MRRGFLGVSAFEDLESALADISLHTNHSLYSFLYRDSGLCVGINLQMQILNLQMQIPPRTPATQPNSLVITEWRVQAGGWAVRRGFLGVSAFED